jgi:hypothetical protein
MYPKVFFFLMMVLQLKRLGSLTQTHSNNETNIYIVKGE